ncbi:hypothetical protein [Microbispora sp. NPDC049633]|uniref:hypothetical protein n=1 Tax=Microbispora sp. NPDC049633 TaxID=3154355 RepID=UPI0034298975
MRRPQKRPGESPADYEERIAPWETMTKAATEFKRARANLHDALAGIRGIQGREGGPWYCREIPESQRDRVQDWRRRLELALSHLEEAHVDEWKTDLYGEGK